MSRTAKPLKDRLLAQISKQENGCWNWTGFVAPNGYGQIKYRRRNLTTHRLSWEVWRGPIPDGLYVLHRCVNNRICINPDHLYLGTQQDNINDMINQGRFRVAHGQENGRSKLTEDQALFILLMKGKMTQKQLAEMFHVVQPAISMIWTRKNWKHLPIDKTGV